MNTRMSRSNQKLIYCLISDYSKYLKQGDFKSKEVSEFYQYKAKQDLKKKYIKHKSIKIADLNAFDNAEDKIHELVCKNATAQQRTSEIINYTISEVQKLFLEVNGSFSLAIKLMSNESAINFTNWLFDFFIYNEIHMRSEIQELYSKEQNDQYVFTMLKNRKCAVCGENGADLHHFLGVGKVGGYKHDTGLEVPFMSLCRTCHSLFHNIGIDEFRKKYLLEGIFLNEKQVEILKKVYKNHFKAARKG